MIHPWHDLQPGPNAPEQITAVIEIPSGSRNKYELDKKTGLFHLDRVLYSAVSYPGDYGLVPRTLHDDGDPLDVLVHVDEPTFPGCQIDVRPLGVLRMLDRGEPDDKIFGVPTHDPRYDEYSDISSYPQHRLREIEHFFQIYKDLEGRRVEIIGWEGNGAAKEIIQRSIAQYDAQYMRVGP